MPPQLLCGETPNMHRVKPCARRKPCHHAQVCAPRASAADKVRSARGAPALCARGFDFGEPDESLVILNRFVAFVRLT